ncbi:hypothetical protein D3C78_485370 [compost metagenome]
MALDALELSFPLQADGFADGLHGNEVFAFWAGDDGEGASVKIDCSELEAGLRHGESPVLRAYRAQTPIWVSGTVRVGVPETGPAGREAPTHGPPITGVAMLRTQKNRFSAVS